MASRKKDDATTPSADPTPAAAPSTASAASDAPTAAGAPADSGAPTGSDAPNPSDAPTERLAAGSATPVDHVVMPAPVAPATSSAPDVAAPASPPRTRRGLAIAAVAVGSVLTAGLLFGGGVLVGHALPDGRGPGVGLSQQAPEGTGGPGMGFGDRGPGPGPGAGAGPGADRHGTRPNAPGGDHGLRPGGGDNSEGDDDSDGDAPTDGSTPTPPAEEG